MTVAWIASDLDLIPICLVLLCDAVWGRYLHSRPKSQHYPRHAGEVPGTIAVGTVKILKIPIR